MIKYNGYYLEEPTQIYNGRSRENKVSYFFNAYLFDKNGSLIVSSKHNHLEYLNNFTKDDFDQSRSVVKEYSTTNHQLILKGSSPYGKEIVLDVINKDKLYNSNADIYLYFVSWDTLENNKINVLRNLYESLDKNKLRTYYE